MSNTFGEVSYNDDVYGGGGQQKQNNNKDLFLRLVEGSNELRLLTAPFQYLHHKYKKDPSNPKDFGQKINCSKLHGDCPLCDAGDKAKPRWFYGVIDRKTGTYKILDVSFAVFQDIRKLARNTKHWGDPTKYDLDIVVDKNGGATGYYTVQAIGKEPLSAHDQNIKDTQVDLDDLKRRCTPPTAEQVQKRIDKINGVDSGSAAQTKKAAPAPAPKPASVSMTDDEDLSETFPEFTDDAT